MNTYNVSHLSRDPVFLGAPWQPRHPDSHYLRQSIQLCSAMNCLSCILLQLWAIYLFIIRPSMASALSIAGLHKPWIIARSAVMRWGISIYSVGRAQKRMTIAVNLVVEENSQLTGELYKNMCLRTTHERCTHVVDRPLPTIQAQDISHSLAQSFQN